MSGALSRADAAKREIERRNTSGLAIVFEARANLPDLPPMRRRALAARRDAQFVVVEVARRILGPGIAERLPGAHARVASADREIRAFAAAAADTARPRLQSRHDRVARVAPDLREVTLLDVAERVVPPEGIGMHLAEVVDVRDVDAARVAAPGDEPLAQRRRQIQVRLQPLQEAVVAEVEQRGIRVEEHDRIEARELREVEHAWRPHPVLERVRLPAVLGEILAGVLLGPYALKWIHPSDTITSIAEMGAIFVLFNAGLETSPGDLIRVGRTALIVALAGILVPFVLGFGYMKLIGDATTEAIFVGAAMVATSVGITARVLKDLGKSDTDIAALKASGACG